MGTERYLCKVYKYDSQACGYKRSGMLSRLDGLDVEWFSFGLSVWGYVIYRIPLWIMLWGIFLIQLNFGSLSLQL
jgi:hypothetical protein